MASLYDISIILKANLKNFSSNLQNAERDLKKFGNKMNDIGKTMSLGVTAPLVGFAAMSAKLWDTQIQAVAQVEAGLKSTGNAVGYTSKELQNMASELQGITRFGDEAILKGVTSQLLTFTSIAKENFNEAQIAVLNMSTRMGDDLTSASIRLGKALNDPIQGITALKRVGVRFTEEQKAVIQSLVETGRTAEAQKLILNELAIEFGGSAEAAAKVGLGPIVQLQNAWGDFMETIGAKVVPMLTPLVEKLSQVTAFLTNMDDRTRTVVITIAAMAASFGPLLIVVGSATKAVVGMSIYFRTLGASITAATTKLSVLKVVMSTIPIIAVVAGLVAIGTAVYQAGKQYEEAGQKVKGFKSAVGDIDGLFTELTQKMVILSNDVKYFTVDFAGFAYELKKLDISTIQQLQQHIMGKLADVTREAANAVTEQEKAMAAAKKTRYQDYLKAIDIELAKSGTSQNTVNDNVETFNKDLKESISLLPKVASLTKEAFNPTVAIEYQSNIPKADEITPGTPNVDNGLKYSIDLMKEYSDALYMVNFEYSNFAKNGNLFADMANVTLNAVNNMIENGIRPTEAAVQSLIDKYKSLEMQAQMVDIISGAIQNMGSALVDAAVSGGNAMQSLKTILIGVVKQIVGAMLAQAISSAIAKGMQSGGNPIIGLALAAVGIAGVMALFSKVPKLAQGGMAYGPTYAMVGDNPGAASDPEVISPLSKLKQYLQPQGVGGGQVEFVLRGDVLKGVITNYDKRMGGVR